MSSPDRRPALAYVHVADVVITDEAESTVLLVHRSDGSWWFPGGRVEEREGLTTAAAREVLEETGYEVDVLGVVAITEEIGPERHVLFATFRGVVRSGARQVPADDPKIVEASWVPVAEAVTRLGSTALPLSDLLERAPVPLVEVWTP